mmetsp:Transcript_31040/g.82537  ORF Transcript_31040/g.82537 Transcript_31040/m.82537 type:complete len:207 (+) Transcript_31040:158-778(+)
MTAERAKGFTAHDRRPVLPTHCTHLVTATERFRWTDVFEFLQAHRALVLVVRGQELKFLFETVKGRCHLQIVSLSLSHHVVHKPLPRVVGDAHGLHTVHACNLLVHIRHHCGRNRCPALFVKLEKSVPHLLDVSRVALIERELRHAFGLIGGFHLQLFQQLLDRAACGATASSVCRETLLAQVRQALNIVLSDETSNLRHAVLFLI